jgi:hypothetical protein
MLARPRLEPYWRQCRRGVAPWFLQNTHRQSFLILNDGFVRGGIDPDLDHARPFVIRQTFQPSANRFHLRRARLLGW